MRLAVFVVLFQLLLVVLSAFSVEAGTAQLAPKRHRRRRRGVGAKCRKNRHCKRSMYCNSGTCARDGSCNDDDDCYNPANKLSKKIRKAPGHLKCVPNKLGRFKSKNRRNMSVGKCVKYESAGDKCSAPPIQCRRKACSKTDCNEHATTCVDRNCQSCSDVLFFNATGDRVCLDGPVPMTLVCASDAQCGDGEYCADGTCRKFGTCGVSEDCLNPSNSFIQILCVGEFKCTDEGTCRKTCGCNEPNPIVNPKPILIPSRSIELTNIEAVKPQVDRSTSLSCINGCQVDCPGRASCVFQPCVTCGTISFGFAGQVLECPYYPTSIENRCKSNDECDKHEYCSSGSCRKDGTCGTDDDCRNPANLFPMPRCRGDVRCDPQGECGKACGCPAPVNVRCVDPCRSSCGAVCTRNQCDPCTATHFDAAGNVITCP